MSDNPQNTPSHQKIERLLAQTPAIGDACSLDLLIFLYRHPRTLLTNEQLAAFVGYEMKIIAKWIDTFIDIGLLERRQNPTHAARMYQLIYGSPSMGGLKPLLELASTRQGRGEILKLLMSSRSSRPTGHTESKRKLLIA